MTKTTKKNVKTAPVKPGKRRTEASAPSKPAKAQPAKAQKAPPAAKPAEKPTAYQIAGGAIAYGTRVSVNWGNLGAFEGVIVAPDDGTAVMDRPIPRVKAHLARVYYPGEHAWADHSADQMTVLPAVKAKGKASKAASQKPAKRRAA